MAPTATTTLRVPVELRDEIARRAQERGGTMLDVVAEAVHRLTRDQWWQSVHEAIDALSAEEVAAYQVESDELDGTAADGLRVA